MIVAVTDGVRAVGRRAASTAGSASRRLAVSKLEPQFGARRAGSMSTAALRKPIVKTRVDVDSARTMFAQRPTRIARRRRAHADIAQPHAQRDDRRARSGSSSRTCSSPRAYKERGALNADVAAEPGTSSAHRAVIAASAGNHAQGLSYHGTRLGIPVTIVMPRTTPTVKVMQTESVGGTVVLEGERPSMRPITHARMLEERAWTDVRPPL